MAERQSSTLKQRWTGLPRWAQLAALAVVALVMVLISKWLILLLLILLGLWPLTLLVGLGVLALMARQRGGWPWMRTWLGARLRSLTVPALAVVSALIVGAIVIMVTDQTVYQALGEGRIGEAIVAAFGNMGEAYGALYVGALGNPIDIIGAIFEALTGGGLQPIISSVRGPSDSLVQSVPYIFAGLAVALGFRAGLFNIGAEGQIGIGWLAAVVVGVSFTGLPAYIHLPLAILAGAVAAGLYSGIAGVLKARTGAHEVIVTIMLNYVSYRLMAWLLCGTSLEVTQGTCRTGDVAASAFLPRFLGHPVTLHWGFVLALVAAAVTGWYLFRTTWGFELRAVGANPNAARYGGMNVGRTYIVTMFLSGCLAGLSGASQGLGITHNIALGFQSGYGFDSIALALLGKSHPVGVVGASILFGVLRAGAGRMQSIAGVPTEIVQIVQSLVIIFIAAPAIIQTLYRLRKVKGEGAELVFTRGWGA